MSERDANGDRVSRRLQVERPSSKQRDAAKGTPPSPHPAESSLDSLDQSIADHADEMLGGAFESVEEVLSHAEDAKTRDRDGGENAESQVSAAPEIDEQSRAEIDVDADASSDQVPDPEAPAEHTDTANAEDAEPDDADQDAADGDTPSAPELEMIPSRDSTVKADTTVVLDESAVETVDGAAASPAAAEDDAALTASAPEPEDSEPTDDAPTEVYNASEDADDGSASDEETDGAAPPVAESTRDAAPSHEDAPQRDRYADAPVVAGSSRRATGAQLLHRSIMSIAALLAILSAPLELLPPSLRPMVDWLALSLIFWVPIVWALVLLLG